MEKRALRPPSEDSRELEGSWGSRESPVGDEDFCLEMDENGIIGLGEELLWEDGSPDLEEEPWSQAGRDLQEDLSELLGSDSLSASPEELRHTLSLCDLEDMRSGNSVVEHLIGEEEEQSCAICGEQAESPPERDGQLEMSEEELDREGGHRGGIGVWLDLTTPGGEEETMTKGGAALAVAPLEQWEDKSEEVKPQEISRSAWPSNTVVQPVCVVDEYNLLTRASVESQEPRVLYPLASDSKPVEGLRGERDPSLFPIPLPRKGKPRLHENMQLSPTPRMSTKAQMSPPRSHPGLCSPTRDSQGHVNPAEAPKKPSKGSPCLDGSRRGQLTHRLPDFSRVEPKVRFPKEVYKPPRSKRPVQGRGSATEMPLVFKSPADIVREVLLSGPDGPPAGPPSLTRSCHPLRAALPQEFRSPQQAHALVHQLQEDYNRLLTKYAEAENTIDRLRLEAKVNLYADPPRPSNPVCSGTISTASSKVMNLAFPQAQKAEFRPTAEPLPPAAFSPEQAGAGHEIPSSQTTPPSRSLSLRDGGQRGHVLSRQAEHFQSRLDSFEDLLRKGKLKLSELIKSLSDLGQEQEALERGYLEARDEHRLLQQQGNESGTFDPDRELEGQIFRSGMRLEELRERVGHGSPEHPLSTALSSPRNGGDPTPLPESPVSPVEGGTVNREVSSVSGESEVEVEPEGEDLPNTFLLPLQLKQERVERDFNTLLDQHQIFKELPRVLDLGQGSAVTDCRAAHAVLPGTNGLDVKHNYAKSVERDQSGNQTPLQGSMAALPDGKPAPTPRKQLKTSLEEPVPNSSRPSGVARVKLHSSSLTSLGESSSSEHQAFKLHHNHGRAPLVDGIVSPETDSGFMGSESSHLTPAVHAPFHQTVRPSDPLAEKGAKSHQSPPEPLSASAPTPTRSQSGTVGLSEHPPLWDQAESRSGLALPSTSSPQHWARSVTSETATCSVSEGEDGRGIGFPSVTGEKLFRQRSPSLSSSRTCIDPFRSGGRGQLPGQRKAIQSLQAEVDRLKESLESSLRHTVAPTIHAGVPHTRNTSLHARSTQHHGDSGQREDAEQEEEELGMRRVERPGPVLRGRSTSTPRRRPEHSTSPDSECARTPTCRAAQGVRRQARTFVTHRGYSSRPEHSVTLPSEDNETNSLENKSLLCPEPWHHPPGKRVPRSSTVSPDAHPCSQHCPLCKGSGQVHRADVNVERDSKTQRVTPHHGQPRNTSRSGSRGWFMNTPLPPAVLSSVPVVQCVPVYPSVLYYASPVLKATPSHAQPVCLPLGESREDTRVRTQGGSRYPRRSHSADAAQLSRSLSQAIEVAANMKITSQCMVHSLTSGLRHQRALTHTSLH
ncbi:AT-hook-containing transcription factor isoform X2 [Scleropages formosus]|uniref:AT-hook-containing transcription factor isoform X2 n=1 Tax=Scleropages formosus TaxID=113540 RepID=UPI000878F42C|nr:AT-hook-containing transcription factor isoform X2 [Scleropages formosus]